MAEHSHSHAHSRELDRLVKSSPKIRVATLAILALVAAFTIIGLVSLWPDYGKVSDLADRTQITGANVTFEQGEVISVTSECETDAQQVGDSDADPNATPTPMASCVQASIGLHSGPDSGRVIDLTVRGALANTGIKSGDHVELVRFPGAEAPAEANYQLAQNYALSGIFRHIPLLVLGVLFAAVVVFVGRIRGLLALVALAISVGVLAAFVLPALITGAPGLPVALVGSSAIMFAILYLVHGPNMRTTAALIGTLCGIIIMSIISLISVSTTRLSGIGDESSGLLSAMTGEIDFRGLLTASIIIAGLGVLNDVTITQASAVWELRAAAPAMSREEIYRRGMRIGRDHIASTVYTVFFAYVGAALSALIVMYLYGQPFLSLLTREDIAIELVRTFCGSIGLVLAVPITTWVAALFVPPALDARGGHGGGSAAAHASAEHA